MNWPAYISSAAAIILAAVALIDRRRRMKAEHDDEACERAKRMIEGFYLGLMQVDRSGRITAANKAARFITGYNNDLIGRDYRILIPERLRERHEIHWSRYWDDPRQRKMGLLGMKTMLVDRLGIEKRTVQSLSPTEDPYGGAEVTIGIEVVLTEDRRAGDPQ